jgi:ElaB/YqjD/DUF883 family membrane-anchored ribosome-binding protein
LASEFFTKLKRHKETLLFEPDENDIEALIYDLEMMQKNIEKISSNELDSIERMIEEIIELAQLKLQEISSDIERKHKSDQALNAYGRH